MERESYNRIVDAIQVEALNLFFKESAETVLSKVSCQLETLGKSISL